MNNEAFLAYIKEHKPYLYDIEAGISKIQDGSGYGEVSATIRIINKTVDKGSFLATEEKLYEKRRHNRLV